MLSSKTKLDKSIVRQYKHYFTRILQSVFYLTKGMILKIAGSSLTNSTIIDHIFNTCYNEIIVLNFQ